MRKFCSYGPIDPDLHYHVPRLELIRQAHSQLVGENPAKGGHYITVWAPRQAGKTWVMQQVLHKLRKDDRFDVLKLNLEHLKMTTDLDIVIQDIGRRILEKVGTGDVQVRVLNDLYDVFRRGTLRKPLILIMDEFDALMPAAIAGIAGVMRNIYVHRQDQLDLPSGERDYLLHGVALIGVRAVLGIESQTGSPFNVQRSVHIPNLTLKEVYEMYEWYERESGQRVEPEVIERVYYETRGQPGLVSWLGELLTEQYNPGPPRPIDLPTFERAYAAATHILPNANILNIISKARHPDYRPTVLELFRTTEKIIFSYDKPKLNFLYLNGVIDWEEEEPGKYYVRFSSPFVQKRLFNYFADEVFPDIGRPYRPFEDLTPIITEEHLNPTALLRRYERYLHDNRDWLLKEVPRRSDLRPYEAVYHFSLYRYLFDFLRSFGGQVLPEFPTGNGKIDLLVRYAGRMYGLEVKSYTNQIGYRQAIRQAGRYGRALGLDEITLAFFVEEIDEPNRARYEQPHVDRESGITVHPVFVVTG